MQSNTSHRMNAVAVRLLILASLFFGQASAFTTSPLSQLGSIAKNKHCRSTAKKGFVLGPVSRNGIEFEDETYGEGRRILPGDTVYCYYTGSFVADAKPKNDGPFAGLLGGGGSSAPKVTVFDQVTEGEPFSFQVGKGQVIKGMDLGILGFDGEITPMNVGGKRKLKIPSGLAYGEEGQGPIPANQDLMFELEVLDAGKDSNISLQFRLGGFAVALGIPAVVAFIAFNILSGNWQL